MKKFLVVLICASAVVAGLSFKAKADKRNLVYNSCVSDARKRSGADDTVLDRKECDCFAGSYMNLLNPLGFIPLMSFLNDEQSQEFIFTVDDLIDNCFN